MYYCFISEYRMVKVEDLPFSVLVLKVELLTETLGSEKEFSLIIGEALRTVLGNCGPSFEIIDFNDHTQKGKVIVERKDLNTVWAALSIYGKTTAGRKIAFHINEITANAHKEPLYS
ncbi:unnamed protein product, partial [Mesorhabditis belari]|uniref:Ribonuclease P n=1 Tax=Mesorhabditis belari TaxID=2138241 RepID=A0AAF3FHA2_9BILA